MEKLFSYEIEAMISIIKLGWSTYLKKDMSNGIFAASIDIEFQIDVENFMFLNLF